MTSPNRFQFDVVADDKASDKVEKITASVQRLIPVLQTANTQFQAIARTIGSIGTVNFGGLAQAQVRAAESQQRSAKQSEAAARRAADAEERLLAAQVNASRQEEAAYQRKINIGHSYTALRAREAAMEKSTSAERIVALDAEVRRAKAVRVEEERRHREAQEYASLTGATARSGSFSDTKEENAAIRESVYAAGQLADAEQRVKTTHADVTAAKRLLNNETKIQAREAAAAAKAAEQEANAAQRAATEQEAHANRLENNLTKTRYALYQTALAYGAVAAAIGAAAAASIKTAMSFETSTATLGRTTGLGITARQGGDGAAKAAGELAALNTELIDMSRNIPLAFEDLAEIGSLGAQLGISEDQVASFTDTVAKFSATTDVASAQAAKSFGQLQNILDVPAAQFNNLGSAVAELGVNSVSTESEILNVATQIGAVANNAGLSAPYVLGLSTALASVRVPPELARGTTTRIFQLIGRAAADGGEDLQAWADSMGLTSQATKQMFENDPEQFFSRFITQLGHTVENGESLIPVLDSLGIKGARDVPVITRLANSYQLLGDYVGTSREAFSSGTFLDEAFAAQTDTAAAAITRLINSARALGASLGGPFLEPIRVVSNALNAFLELLNKIPAAIAAPVIGLLVGVGAFAAYRAAIALGTATLFAYQVAQRGLAGAAAESGTVFTGFSRVLVNHAISSIAAKGATDSLTASTAATGAAAAAAIPPIVGVGTATTAAGGAAAVATGWFGKMSTALKVFGGIGLVIGLIASVVSIFTDSGEEADQAAQKQKALNDEFMAMGTGAAGLKKALDEDTAAWEASGRQADLTNGVYQTVEQQIGNSTGALETQTVALGKNVDAWRKNNIMEMLKQSFGNGSELQAAINRIGIGKLDDILTRGLQRGAAGVKDYLTAAKLDLASLEEAINEATITDESGAQRFTGSQNMLERRKNIQQMIADLEKVAAAAETSKLTIDEQINADSAFATLRKLLGDDVDALFDVETQAGTTAEQIQLAQEKYQAFVDSVTKPLSLETGLLDSFSKLGESIGENGPDFSQFSESGRKNLEALTQTIDAFDAIQQNAIQKGQISAKQAAINMQAFVADLLNQLSAMGIDTSPLDVLEARLAAITGFPSTAIVNVDVSAGLNNLAILQRQIAATATIQNAVNATTGNLFKKVGAGIGAVVNTPATTPNLAGAVPRAVLAQQLVSGRAKAANDAAEKAGKAAGKANNSAADAAKNHASYLKEIAGYYDKLGSSILGAVKAEGETFSKLDDLGRALNENGRSFNTVTESGRKNFDALASTLDAFGGTLGDSVERGTISVDQAQVKYREFARGLYSELVKVGVPTAQLSGMFRALGVNATDGWAGASAEVAQYAGRITEAASATADFLTKTTAAEEWAEKLGDAFNRVTERQFGLSDAVDSVQSAMNELRNGYQDSIDKALELRRANESLAADLGTAQADKRKAEIEQSISLRYGETDRAADYGAQAGKAQAEIAEIQAKIDANAKERATLEEGRTALDGYSDAAIDNRKALSDLQKQILDQIVAYAKTGATTQQVTEYTDRMAQEFASAARSAGFTDSQIQRYTGTFRTYADVIRAIPRSVDITTTNLTRAVLDEPNYEYVKWKLGLIPKELPVQVSPSVNQGALDGVNAQLGGIGTNVNAGFGNIVSGIGRAVGEMVTSFSGLFSSFKTIGQTLGSIVLGRAQGGVIPGYPFGGQVMGPAPSNPNRDNLLARGPDGSAIGLQGGEFVIRRSAVQKWGLSFLSSINSGNLSRGYAQGSGSSNVPITVEAVLSPQDRALLAKIAQQGPANLYADSMVIASTASKGNVRMATRGQSR